MNYLEIFPRTFKKFIGILILVLILGSCEDFLTENPQSSVGVTNFYKTNDDFVQAVNGIYAVIQGMYTGNQAYILNDMRSDNLTCNVVGGNCASANEGIESIDEFRMTSSSGPAQSIWQTQYGGIARANRVITYIQDKDFEDKGELMGQAKALRAFFYFNLVRQFGAVPLVTTPSIDINTDRVSVDKVYAQIISDLQDAEQSLPVSYDNSASVGGRITKGTAQSILGTVYLTQNKYQKAVDEFKKVVESGTYSLRSNYADLWISSQQGQGNESIWRVIYIPDGRGNGSKYPNWYCPNLGNSALSLLGPKNGNAFGFFIPTLDLEKTYLPGDKRKSVLIGDGFTDVVTNNYVRVKYVKCYVQQPTNGGGLESDADWYIIRYANVLLRYAEAINEQNQGPTQAAYDALNKVRNRAGLPDISGLSHKDFQSEVYLQERLESPFEGHRWNTLVRQGRAVAVMNSKIAYDSTTVGPQVPIQKNNTLFPIPQVALTRSGISQNPGY